MSPQIEVHTAITEIGAKDWQRFEDPNSPFMDFDFLEGLERTQCVGEQSGWIPAHIVIRDSESLVGVTPHYIKFNSHGEYTFDWEWVDAYQRAGLSYYPKSLVAAPFSPVSCQKIGMHRHIANALLDFADKTGLSGSHVLHIEDAQHSAWKELGYLPRLNIQFHWQNRQYRSFDDFLAVLRSSKRKSIRKERQSVLNQGLTIKRLTGSQIKPEHMEAMWAFYQSTHARKWGQAYLNRVFFEHCLQTMTDRILIVLAYDGDQPIAGTMSFYKGHRLFGRYWGANQAIDGLHFELCLYQLIEFAIEHELDVVEAGAQGEHKFLRGFDPVFVHSQHHLRLDEGQQMARQYLQRETHHLVAMMQRYQQLSPVKATRQAALDLANSGTIDKRNG